MLVSAAHYQWFEKIGVNMKKINKKKKVIRKAAKKKAVRSPKKNKDMAVEDKLGRKSFVKPISMAKVKLNKKIVKEFKNVLVAMKMRLTGQIASLKDDSLHRDDSVNSEEDGTDAFDRQFALNIASTENDVVYEVDEALQRIEQGAYGICEQCKGLIELPRLRAAPYVRMCIKCKTENEKGTLKYRPLPELERPERPQNT